MMKIQLTTKISALTVLFFLLIGCSSTVHTDVDEPLTYQVFYDNLSPYGSWIEYPGYGHVWNPDIVNDFSPYLTNGRWVATSAGWTWISDYRWGWAPFHYGRWFYDNRYGWLWIPGYEWSPAWVTWGTMNNYYCWAPLMPSVDVTIAFDNWSPPDFYWHFCPHANITNTHLHHVAVPGTRGNIHPIRNFQTTSIHHHYYATGPAFADVERETRTSIRPVSIESVNRSPNRVSRGRMEVFRPQIETPEGQQRRSPQPRPSEYRNAVEQQHPVGAPSVRPTRTDRKQQRENIRTLPQGESTRRR
ncbi:MAG: hypothetical protein M0D53_12210 [Flavobacterium sp. JAD_PAG50586_2]|nr:MAG: hypothetical protein M0D53_12210 [Flavobacterium sp. JAD_PAG50586_2]